MSTLVSLAIYTAGGFVMLIMAGLQFHQCAGFGLMFGFIMGALNEIHRDLYQQNHPDKK